MKHPIVSCKNVKKYFVTKSETVKALDGIDIDVFPGDFMVFAGPSGSGKTTLLNLIGMLDTPTEGEIDIHGKSVTSLTRTQQANLRKQEIGFIFQAYNLIPVLSVLENVEYIMLLQGEKTEVRRARSLEVLREVGLEGMENRRPAELSGGQQQRVAVARAIASRPAIILADEPTANLDSHTGESLLDVMEELNKAHGISFIFSTHDPKVMQRAARLVSLKDGKIESRSDC